MTVAVRIVTFPVSRQILSGGHFRTMQPVRRGKEIAACEMSFHRIFD